MVFASALAWLAWGGEAFALSFGEPLLVSRADVRDGGSPAQSAYGTSISSDGRFVAFDSSDITLSPAAQVSDNVYRHDIRSGATELVSRQRAAEGGRGGDHGSHAADMSSDGRYVLFQSGARNLADVEGFGGPQLYLRDMEERTTTLVSRQSAEAGGAPGQGRSGAGTVSDDGRFVAFSSQADNLAPGTAQGASAVYLRDLEERRTIRLSGGIRPGLEPVAYQAYRPSISANGQRVVFHGTESHDPRILSGARASVWSYELGSGAYSLVSTIGSTGRPAAGASGSSSISADGRYVTFLSTTHDIEVPWGGGSYQVFLRDMETGQTSMVSRQSDLDGGRPADSLDYQSAPVSDDGRFVVFSSDASNLRPFGDHGHQRVYVRDLQAHMTVLASSSAAGAPADDRAYASLLSGDGGWAGFSSSASNITDESSAEEVSLGVYVRSQFADRRPPGIDSRVLARSGQVIPLRVTCSERCSLSVVLRARGIGKRRPLGERKAEAGRRAAATVRFKVGSRTARSLCSRRRAKLVFRLTGWDAENNEARQRDSIRPGRAGVCSKAG